jgi:hypothetical protein
VVGAVGVFAVLSGLVSGCGDGDRSVSDDVLTSREPRAAASELPEPDARPVRSALPATTTPSPMGVEAWMRSEPVDGDGGLARVNVEVIAVMRGQLPGFKPRVRWTRVRVDVVWEDDSWKVIRFARSTFGPLDVPGEKMVDYLKGPGWRQFQPA